MTETYEYTNKTGSSNWDQPCVVSIHVHDLDHAHKLAEAIQGISLRAASGGDFGLIGVVCDEPIQETFIGHDVRITKVSLVVGE